MLGRTLDKIRLHQTGLLPPDYNLGHGLDGRLCRFLKSIISASATASLPAQPTKSSSNGVSRMAANRRKRKSSSSTPSWKNAAGETM